MPHPDGPSVSTPLAGAETDAVQPRRPGRLGAWPHPLWFTWILFLGIPIFIAFTLDNTPNEWRWITVGVTVLFGLVWLRIAGHFEVRETEPWTPRHSMEFAIAMVLLIAIAAGTAPGIRFGAFAFTPYLAALALFTLPPLAGFSFAIAVGAAVVVTSWALTGTLEAGVFVGPLIGILCVTLSRVMAATAEREERIDRERASIREREAISRDIHDILGHSLTVVALKTQLARRTLRDDPARAEAELDEVLALTQTALDDVRATVGQLRQPDLASQVEASARALRDAGIDVSVRGDWERLSPDRRALAAWTVREATTNVLRHADATSCVIEFTGNRVTVTDNGVGVGQASDGHGLTGLRRRTAESGGTLSVLDGADGGTRVEVRFA